MVSVFLMGHSGVAEQLLASWEEGATTPSHTPVAGIGASLGLTSAAEPYASGSTDGTYGTFGSGASVISNSFRIQTAETFTLTVNNHTVSNLNLAAIRFDFVRRFNNSPENILVSYESGAFGAGPVQLFSTNVLNNSTESGDYPDFDVLLSPALTDTELAPTQSAVFTVTISGGAGARSMLDNLAVTGELTTLGTVPRVFVTIDPFIEKWTISPNLIGAHTVYYNDKDAAYSDDAFATWCRQAGVSTMRFPGGSVVKYWDWESPSGTATGDPWNPGWDGFVEDESEWMNLDEYLHFCDLSGITPLVGVNYRSGYLYGRMQDSIDRAARCVQHVVDAGHLGAYWYIGNEDMVQVGGIYGSATNFIAHAAAMKAVDSTIKIFWNDNGAEPANMKAWLTSVHPDYPGKAGDYADGFEFHGKWPFGGDPGPAPPVGAYSNWLTEVPLRDYKAGPDPNPRTDDPNDWGKTWRDKVTDLRAAAAEVGFPDLLMANNEYGWGKGGNFAGFNKYTMGLLQTEFLQEHFIADYDMACFWANIRGTDSGLLDKANDYARNPQTLGWELLAAAQGATMVESTSSHPYVFGFAARTPSNMYVYLLNKTEQARSVAFSFAAMAPDQTHLPEGRVMRDSADHYGTLADLDVSYNEASNAYVATVPALSYARVDFGALKVPTPYGAWAADFGLTNGPNGNDDGDALNNLYEYGLGGDPTNPADVGLPSLYKVSGALVEYVYPRRSATKSGLTYYLELNDDLISGSWTNAGSLEMGAGEIDADFEAVTNHVTAAGKTNEFIRLRITGE